MDIEDSGLKLDETNARKHSERNKEAIRSSVEQFGAGRSILADADGIVRAGNGTFEAWIETGGKVRVIESDGTELIAVKRTDLKGDRATAYAIADNRATDMSEFDDSILVEQLQIVGEEFDMSSLFNEDEIQSLIDEDDDLDDGFEGGDGNAKKSIYSFISLAGLSMKIPKETFEKWEVETRRSPGFENKAWAEWICGKLGIDFDGVEVQTN